MHKQVDHNKEKAHWFRMDLHIHPPNPSHYGGSTNPLLEILREAREKSLDIVGLVDHNTARGYEQLRLEISRLAVLQEAGRLSPDKEALWQEYQELLSGLLLLPGFELTTREGIPLLALFPPETPAERLYALLLNMGIPMDRLRESEPTTQAEADVSTACGLVYQAGGIVIGACDDFPSTSSGKETTALPDGLLALESAELPENVPPTPLPLVWFSQAHCLCQRHGAPSRQIGDRYTEIPLEELSFAALKALLEQREQRLLRFPLQQLLRIHLARMRQESAGRLILRSPTVEPAQIYRDIAALANGGGGVLLLGLDGEALVGVQDPEAWSTTLLRQSREHVDPPPHLNLELLHYGDREIIRIEVLAEEPPPYLTSEGVVYLWEDDQTRPAGRSELLQLVSSPNTEEGTVLYKGLDLPQAGVEIVGAQMRNGVWFYDVRDLRITSGVTRKRAKGLWSYAIERHSALQQGQVDLAKIRWKGDRGVWRAYYSGEREVFDLVHRDSEGHIDHVFYGVSEWGLIPSWREVIESLRPAFEQERRPSAPPSSTEGTTPAGAAPRGGTVTETEVQPPAVPKTATPAAVSPPQGSEPVRPSPDAWGGRLPRWRGQAAVERVYWEGHTLLFDLAMRQQNGQIRYFRRVRGNQLAESKGWVELVQVSLPATGVEVVRSTTSGQEILYQFRDMRNDRVDPRVRRESDFPPDSPHAYAIRMFHQDKSLDEGQIRWWGNIGYMRPRKEGVDLIYRDEQGRDHIYYAAKRDRLTGEWEMLFQVWEQDG